MVTTAQKAQILAYRGEMSYQMIADALSLTRGQVAGVCFRVDRGTKRAPVVEKRRGKLPKKYFHLNANGQREVYHAKSL